jgi:hypothetical protein
MSPSAQCTLEQLKEIIEDKRNTDKGGRGIQKHVEDGEKVLDPANTSCVVYTVFCTINNKFEPKYLAETVRLLNAYPIPQSTDDQVPGQKHRISGLPGITFLGHQG